MAELTPDQQKEYDAMLASYKPVGSFGNQSIVHYKKYVTGNALDVKSVMQAEGLNGRQIPFLEAELKAAGFIKEEQAEGKPEEADEAILDAAPDSTAQVKPGRRNSPTESQS